MKLLSKLMLLTLLVFPEAISFAQPSLMLQGLLGVVTPMTPASLLNTPSGTYYDRYLDVTVDTVGGASFFKYKVGIAASTDCKDSTGYSASTAISDTAAVNIFTSQTPTGEYNDATSYEMGVKFRTTFTGKVTGIRYYRPTSQTGTPTGRLWDDTQTQLASVSIPGGGAGWKQASFATPVTIQPNRTYLASVNTPNYYATSGLYALSTSIANGGLFTLQDGKNMLFSNPPGVYPTLDFNSQNYFRDLVFVRTSHIVDDLASLPNTTLKLCVVVRDAAGNWQDFGLASSATWTQASNRLGSSMDSTGHNNQNPAGEMEAFAAIASSTTTVNNIRFFLRSTNAATTVYAGIYSDSANTPLTLLAHGSIGSPVANAWNNIILNTGVSLTSGTKYWIGILGTGGTMRYFSGMDSGTLDSCVHATTGLSALPATFSLGARYSNESPLQAFAF